MSKVNDMRSLFDKQNKKEPEKKAPTHTEKKPTSSNSSSQKNEPSHNTEKEEKNAEHKLIQIKIKKKINLMI